MLVALAGAAFYYLYRQANERISATEAEVTDEVLASHQLVTLAGAAADPELLRSVLSGADEGWARAQARRVENGMLAEHARFGLQLVPGSAETPTVTLDPELRSAELTWPARFVVTDSAGITQTVQLTQTAIYRRGSNSWLFAPPRPDFWGGSDEYRGEYLEAIYAEREEEVAEQLAADLDELLARLCSSRSCPPGFHLRLILSTDPASFDGLDTRSLLNAGRTVALPTPTLVGLPADGAAFAALQRGYARLVSTAVLGELAEYGCCRGELYAEGWLHLQQSQLGLRPWPMDAAAYERLLLHLPSLTEYSFLMRSDTLDFGKIGFEEWAVVYAFAQFMDEYYHPALAASAVNTPFTRLLQQNGVSTSEWTSAFARFIYEHSTSGQLAEPPLPLPEADLAVRCETGNNEMTLRQLDLQSGQWQTLFRERYDPTSSSLSYSYAEPLRGGNGLAIIGRQASETTGAGSTVTFTIHIARGGITTTLFSASGATWDELAQLYPSGSDPQGRYLVLGDYSPQRGARPTHYSYSLVALDSCDGDSCDITPVPGPLQWSPDGSKTLVLGESPAADNRFTPDYDLYVGNAAAGELVPVERARLAAWLDNERYFYVAGAAQLPELVVRAVPGSVELGRIPLSRLWSDDGAAEPQPAEGAALQPLTLIASPQDPHRVVVAVSRSLTSSRDVGERYLVDFTADWGGVAASRLLGDAGRMTSFSGSGRWVANLADNYRGVGSELIDLSAPAGGAGKRQSSGPDYQVRQWAPSGDWLPLNGETHVLLYNPSAGYSYFVPFEDSSCYFYVWLEG